MFVSALAAIAMFAAPATAESGQAPAKPAMERVCEKITVVGSTIPKRKCVNRPVKVAETAENAEERATDVAKTE
jgi:hypothetical protein